jgi:putative ABC transport system substrate-binding protein
MGKRIELLMAVMPHLSRVGAVWDPANQGTQTVFQELQAAADALRLAVASFEVTRREDFDGAFARAAASGPLAVAVLNSPAIISNRDAIVAAAARHKVPAIYYESEFVAAGGLMSYGAHIPDLFRRAAGYVDKILKGARPAELPVEQPTKFELAVNLKAAKALGLTIPQSILVRVDEVIE